MSKPPKNQRKTTLVSTATGRAHAPTTYRHDDTLTHSPHANLVGHKLVGGDGDGGKVGAGEADALEGEVGDVGAV